MTTMSFVQKVAEGKNSHELGWKQKNGDTKSVCAFFLIPTCSPVRFVVFVFLSCFPAEAFFFFFKSHIYLPGGCGQAVVTRACPSPTRYFPGLFAGHDPTRGPGQEVSNLSRVESGRVRTYHGSGRDTRPAASHSTREMRWYFRSFLSRRGYSFLTARPLPSMSSHLLTPAITMLHTKQVRLVKLHYP